VPAIEVEEKGALIPERRDLSQVVPAIPLLLNGRDSCPETIDGNDVIELPARMLWIIQDEFSLFAEAGEEGILRHRREPL
jgi:hypothetical protein